MLKHKRKAFFLFCLLGLIVNIFVFKRLSLAPYELVTLSESLSTCFSRVSQSNTSKLLNFSSSSHLSENFLLKTEQCFADTVLLASLGLTGASKVLSSKINLLGSDTHWFFEKISKSLSLSAFTKKGESGPLSFKDDFIKLEKSYLSLLSDIEEEKIGVKRRQEIIQVVLYINLILMGLCIVFAVLGFITYLKQRNKIEDQAEIELKQNGASEKGKEILKIALDFADLPRCRDLLSEWGGKTLQENKENQKDQNYNQNNQSSDENKENSEKEREVYIPTVIMAEKKKEKSNFEELNEANKKALSHSNVLKFTKAQEIREEKLDVAEVLSSIIEQLSIKFFTQGVRLEINIDEKVSLDWEKDAFEHIVYDVIAKTLELCPTHVFLDFYKKKKFDALKISFICNQSFNLSFMRSYYELTDVLLKEFGGKVAYPELGPRKTALELDFSCNYERIKKRSKKERELVRFKKTSKRELEREFLN